jgi:hypothetical protein
VLKSRSGILRNSQKRSETLRNEPLLKSRD